MRLYRPVPEGSLNMPSPSSNPIAPSLANIQAPPRGPLSPQEQFEADVQVEVKKRTDDTFRSTLHEFTGTGAGASDPDFQDIVTHNKAKYTDDEYKTAVREFIEHVQTSTLSPADPAKRPPPLFTSAEIRAHPYAATLPKTRPISVVENNLERILHSHLEQAVSDGVHAAINKIRGDGAKQTELKQQQKSAEMGDLVRMLEQEHPTGGAPPPPIDLDTWINTGIKYMKNHDRQRLAETGLVTFPAGTDHNGNHYAGVTATNPFSELKDCKRNSAICTTIAGVAVGAAVLGSGGMVGFGVAAGVAALNWVAQSLIHRKRNDVVARTFTEIKSELDKTKPDGCVAWAGLLYKFINEANPLWLYPNSSQLFRSAKATKVPAILTHLASAAAAAITQEHGITSYTKGMDYKDHLKRVETPLSDLVKRWDWWHDTQSFLAPAMTLGSALMSASLWAQTIAPHIP